MNGYMMDCGFAGGMEFIVQRTKKLSLFPNLLLNILNYWKESFWQSPAIEKI